MTASQFLALAAFVVLLLLWLDVALFWHVCAAAVIVPAVAHIIDSNQ